MGFTAPGVRALLAWASVVCAGAVVFLLVPDTSADARPGMVADTERGGELYQRWCAVCHANDGTGTRAGPPIDDVSIALADLTMRTGDMPLADENHGVRERRFNATERQATLAYMVEEFELSGEVAEPGSGDAGRGQDQYTVHCAQCHGATGEGGVAGRDATVPKTRGVEPILIAQAVRAGPFQMPPFSMEQIDDGELADIVAFLEDHPSNSPLGLADLNRVDAFAWAVVLFIVILCACWWITKHPVAPDADLTGEREGTSS